MLESIADAIERKDYRTAAKQLKPLVQKSPDDPWVRFYVARVHEGSKNTEKAEKLYRQLLKTATNKKIISGARQGLQRIQTQEQEARQSAIAQATTQGGRTGLGGLIIEPLSNEAKTKVVPSFARMMQLDPYAARLLLPTRGWRFYRTGEIGALQVYVEELRTLGIPAFCAALEDLAAIPVFQVHELTLSNGIFTAQPPATASDSQPLRFQAKEVRACIEGALPIFESVVDVNRLKKEQFVRKEQVKDYIKVLDLHLSDQILRLYATSYRYERQDSIESRYASIPQLWHQLLNHLQESLPKVTGSDRFKQFAATVLEQEDFLRKIQPHVELSNASALVFHDDAPPWHEAFHLYSTLAFSR